MPNSYAHPYNFICSQCTTSFNAFVWVIVDILERPDLGESIRDGSLQQVVCPKGHSADANAPLILYHADRIPPFFFSPPSYTTETAVQEQAAWLLSILRSRVGAAWRDEWTQLEPPVIPRPLLPIAFGADVQSAFREALGQVFPTADRSSEGDLVSERLDAMAREMKQDVSLLKLFQQFADAESRTTSRQIVELHPELLSKRTMSQVDRMIVSLRQQGNVTLANSFAEHQNILRRIQEVGIDRAFAEVDQEEEEQTAWREFVALIDEFYRAGTWEESRKLLENHPELLEPQAFALLAEIQRVYSEKGLPLEAQSVAEHTALLHDCINDGIPAAFRTRLGRKGNVPPELQALIVKFMNADSWNEKRRMLDEHPEFLEPRNLIALGEAQRFWSQIGYEYNAQIIALHLRFLHRVLEVGADRALAEAIKESTVLGREVTDELGNLLIRFLNANTWGEKGEIVVKHPELLSQEILDLLENGRRIHDANEETERARDLAQHIAFLQRCREANVEQACEEMRRAQRRDRASEREQGVAPKTSGRPFPPLPPALQSIWETALTTVNATGDGADIDSITSALEAWQHFVEQPDSADLPFHLGIARNETYTLLVRRFDITHDLNDLNMAIGMIRESLESPSQDPLTKSIDQHNLGSALAKRYDAIGNPNDLEEGISQLKAALAAVPEDSPLLPSRLVDLALALASRYGSSRDRADLDEAISTCRQALKVISGQVPDRHKGLASLGKILLQRYEAFNEMADLQDAIAALDEAITICTNSLAHRTEYSFHLADALVRYSEVQFDRHRAQQSINLYEQLEHTISQGSSRWWEVKTHLGHAWIISSEISGSMDELDRGIQMFHQVLEGADRDSAVKTGCLNALGEALVNRFEMLQQQQDLDSAIAAFDEAINTTSNVTFRIRLQDSLAHALTARFEAFGQEADLMRAVSLLNEALQVVHVGSAEWVSCKNQLGLTLRDRFDALGDIGDLDVAIMGYYDVLNLPSRASLPQPQIQHNLGTALTRRFQLLRRTFDLEEGIHAFEKSLDGVREGTPEWANRKANLGVALAFRFEKDHQSEDLDTCILVLQQGLSVPQVHTARRIRYLINLANALGERVRITWRLYDADNAIQAYQKVLEMIPVGSPLWAETQIGLGHSLQARSWLSSRETDRDAAIDAYNKTLSVFDPDTIPERAYGALQSLGELYFNSAMWDEAAHYLLRAVHALNRLYRTQILNLGRGLVMSSAGATYRDAAYSLARVGRLNDAVVCLEQGRARGFGVTLWRDLSDLEHLKSESPELYARFKEAADHMRQLETEQWQTELAAGYAPIASQRLIELTRRASNALNEAILAIQRIPSLVGFVAEPSLDVIKRAAQYLPIVYIVTTDAGSMALLVYHGKTRDLEVESVWADSFIENDVRDLLIKRKNSEIVGGYLYAQFSEDAPDTTLFAALDDMLPILGERLVAPIFHRLKQLDAKGAILIPTGLLNLLPLHAAFSQIGRQSRLWMDDFILSYSPSAVALGYASQISASLSEGPTRLLAVGDPLPLPTGLRPLNFARAEAVDIAALFGDAAQILLGTKATREAVERCISSSHYLHFACHGQFDVEQPLSSGVLLSKGEQLALIDLLTHLRVKNVRLAVLSACKTALTDFIRLPDEAIGLPAGLLQAGVPGVVGTLWPVNDLSTMLLMVKFYEAHLKEGLAPAAALRKAQLWLRDVTNAELSELFARYKLTATDRPASTRMAYEMASEKFREHTLRDPNERPYAHPYYWAPFVFYGV